MTFVFFTCRRRQGVNLLSSKLVLVTGKRAKSSQSTRSRLATSIHLQAHRHWKSQKPIHHQIDEENERQESCRQRNVRIVKYTVYITLPGRLGTTLQTK